MNPQRPEILHPYEESHVAIHPFRIASVCAGVGGIDLGISLAIPGARTVVYVEREAYAAATIVARMEDQALDQAPIWDDLATFDGRPWRGVVDCIVAGLPCQPYSTAGRQQGHADERAIWPQFIRVVKEVQPAMVFIENVPTFVTRGWFREPGEKLSNLGYQIEDPLFLAAEDIGAPHRRERVFILAHRQGERDRAVSAGRRREDRHHAAHADGQGEELAVTRRSDHERRGEPGILPEAPSSAQGEGLQRQWSGHTPGDSSSAMAHSLSQRRQARGSVSAHGAGPPSGERLADGSEALEDASGNGRPQHLEPAERAHFEDSGTQLGSPNCVPESSQAPGRPLFPPGPKDYDAWAAVLDRWPELVPAAHGGINRRLVVAEIRRALRGMCGPGNRRTRGREAGLVAQRLAAALLDQEAQSTLSGMADGPAARVDQLRASGNGVVPLVVAVAFAALCRDAGIDWVLADPAAPAGANRRLAAGAAVIRITPKRRH